jgi:hypothetical protein
VGDEDDRRAGPLPDPEQLDVHPLARHLVERPERLVHQEELGLDHERPGDRGALLHAARELPWVVAGEVAELDEVEHLARAPLTLARGHAEDFQRQLHVRLDRSPVEQHRGLEDHPVVAVDPCPLCRLAVHLDAPARRLREVADQPQEGALSAAGRADEADELAGADGEIDVFEGDRRTTADVEPLPDARDLDHRGGLRRSLGCRHSAACRLRRTSISATRTRAKKAIPTTAQAITVAHSFSGPDAYCWLKLMIARPSPPGMPVGASATIAPTMLAVALIFRAVNR